MSDARRYTTALPPISNYRRTTGATRTSPLRALPVLPSIRRQQRDIPVVYEEKSAEEDKDSCSICLEDLDHYALKGDPNEVIQTACKHNFHKTCINEWVATNPVCPNCKTPIEACKICDQRIFGVDQVVKISDGWCAHATRCIDAISAWIQVMDGNISAGLNIAGTRYAFIEAHDMDFASPDTIFTSFLRDSIARDKCSIILTSKGDLVQIQYPPNLCNGGGYCYKRQKNELQDMIVSYNRQFVKFYHEHNLLYKYNHAGALMPQNANAMAILRAAADAIPIINPPTNKFLGALKSCTNFLCSEDVYGISIKSIVDRLYTFLGFVGSVGGGGRLRGKGKGKGKGKGPRSKPKGVAQTSWQRTGQRTSGASDGVARSLYRNSSTGELRVRRTVVRNGKRKVEYRRPPT